MQNSKIFKILKVISYGTCDDAYIEITDTAQRLFEFEMYDLTFIIHDLIYKNLSFFKYASSQVP